MIFHWWLDDTSDPPQTATPRTIVAYTGDPGRGWEEAIAALVPSAPVVARRCRYAADALELVRLGVARFGVVPSGELVDVTGLALVPNLADGNGRALTVLARAPRGDA